MVQIIQDPSFSEGDFKTFVALLEKHGGLAYTEKTAQDYIDLAKNSLSIFKSSRAKETMLDIADYALARRV